jgi:hypothetical protein
MIAVLVGALVAGAAYVLYERTEKSKEKKERTSNALNGKVTGYALKYVNSVPLPTGNKRTNLYMVIYDSKPVLIYNHPELNQSKPPSPKGRLIFRRLAPADKVAAAVKHYGMRTK